MTVPRLIPDINTLLSGITSKRGPSNDLYEAARRFDVIFVLCEQHFNEMAVVLSYPGVLKLGGGALTPALAFSVAAELHRLSEYYPRISAHDWPSCPDPKDWYLLDLLVASDADGIVSKDKHLHAVKRRIGLPIYEPKDLARLGII